MSLILRKLTLSIFLSGFTFLILISGCGGSGNGDDNDKPDITKSYTISWDANREKSVNTTGGGYRVYYSQTQNFDVTGASFLDVPYVSGTHAPTSATLSITGSEGSVWYIKVIAYSALNSGSVSRPSAEQSVTLE